METRASYILVGVCTILAIAVFVGIIMFNAERKNNQNVNYYLVYFQEGVSGLSTGNPVLFNGVRLGSVKDISLSKADQSVVRVTLEMDSHLVIKQDCSATQQIQGITGQTAIYISGGSAASPPLADTPGEEYPVIPAGKSTMESLAAQAPDLIASANHLLNRGSELVSPQNVQNFSRLLESTAKLSSTLADRGESLAQTLDNLNKSSITLQKVLANANLLVEKDLRGLSNSAKSSLDRLDNILAETQPEMQKFSRTGLDEFGRLLTDTRKLVRDLDQLVKKIDHDPRSLLFGEQLPEYRP